MFGYHFKWYPDQYLNLQFFLVTKAKTITFFLEFHNWKSSYVIFF